MVSMYIPERIVSIAIYLLLTAIVVLEVVKSDKDYKKIRRWLIFYVFALCFLSFFYIPAETSDLTRLRVFMNDTYSDMSFEKFMDLLKSTSTYTTHIYYYVIAKIGVQELISVISCLINYSIICYVLYDYAKRNNLRGYSIVVALLLYVSVGGYLDVVSGFRSMCAFSIFFLCIYREFFQGKQILSNVFLYFIAIGFHNAVVPVIAFRFVFMLFQKEKSLAIKLFNYLLFGVLVLFSIRYGSTILDATTQKAQVYLNNEIFSYFWTYLSSILTVCIIAYTLLINRLVIKKTIPRSYIVLVVLFLILDAVSVTMDYTIFRRYSRVLVMLSLPLVMESFNCEMSKTGRFVVKKKNVLYYILLFTILFIEVSRGDLCGIKFFMFS